MSRINQLKTFLKDNPKDSFLLYALAKEYQGSGQFDEALHQFQVLLEEDPNYVGAYYHLGKLYESMEQPSKAFFTYKKGMEVADLVNDQHAKSELAGAKLNLGDDEDFEEV